MQNLKISYSGIRGIFGQGLDCDTAFRFGKAYARLISLKVENPLIIIGKDTRPSGEKLKKAVLSGLNEIPCQIVDLGTSPTPTVEVMAHYLKADGGIIVTASHNPLEWNGFKFLLGKKGIVLDAKQTEKLLLFYEEIDSNLKYQENFPLPKVKNSSLKAVKWHIKKIISKINFRKIKERQFKIVIDSAQGAGEIATKRLLKELGCKVISLNIKRSSEPIPENLKELIKAVKENEADCGFAQDLDADRLAIVSEIGIPLGEEYTLALAAKHLLEKYKGKKTIIVKNSSTSKMIDDLAELYQAKLVEVRVGEVNLSSAILEYAKSKAVVFGGEGNGGVIYPSVGYGRDSLIGIALILEYLAFNKNEKLSQLSDYLPKYYILKEKKSCFHRQVIDEYIQKLKNKYAHESISYFDGIKINFKDGSWCQIRPSNTEPILRLIVETKDLQDTRKIMQDLLTL
ncbi:MAG: phosphoglucosamine mutase [Armatimonadetes bacterium]|nr:phosphoglucosamine mutase [Armatimonadota bacterium]